jgi:hypothetical protein
MMTEARTSSYIAPLDRPHRPVPLRPPRPPCDPASDRNLVSWIHSVLARQEAQRSALLQGGKPHREEKRSTEEPIR